MTYGGSDRPTKNERREAAREKARQLREEQRRRERRNKFLIQGGVIVAVVAIVALIGTLIWQNIQPEGPGPRNMASDGIVYDVGMVPVETTALEPDEAPTATVQDESGTIANIVTYVDYLCPFCGQFETTNGDQIRTMVESGAATIEIHPVAILTNRSAGSQYSLRAANAAGCVADASPEQFYDFNALLFANQPEEGTTGLSNDELKALAAEAGASSLSSIEQCIDDTEFKGWVQDATNRFLSEPIPNSDIETQQRGTPTVVVNGKQYTGSLTDPAEFASFVLQATADTYTEATATPTPEPDDE
ncbi:hypothetical protein ARHIZOSPH14_23690 [Agromyces rhizosphaerae]|uniref:Thioredoxin-like fold domain-containing protein n=1 Tax=Agromyces rhizosphaerae TaxID=88374 RepID=A0A9W6FRX3_9MICO|nr:thioredoxin domain-containing protein [Agromyces rhizosphaerae]GLI28127.1 hypothetical protein ARHIZOSPH14_23690 [Agromyces rhizosphaerae]